MASAPGLEPDLNVYLRTYMYLCLPCSVKVLLGASWARPLICLGLISGGNRTDEIAVSIFGTCHAEVKGDPRHFTLRRGAGRLRS
jgi:hypothetical protein